MLPIVRPSATDWARQGVLWLTRAMKNPHLAILRAATCRHDQRVSLVLDSVDTAAIDAAHAAYCLAPSWLHRALPADRRQGAEVGTRLGPRDQARRLRMQAHLRNSGVRLLTRNGHDWADRYPAVTAAITALRVTSCLIDGMIAVTDYQGLTATARMGEAGKPSCSHCTGRGGKKNQTVCTGGLRMCRHA
jgi:hypothetical protein